MIETKHYIILLFFLQKNFLNKILKRLNIFKLREILMFLHPSDKMYFLREFCSTLTGMPARAFIAELCIRECAREFVPLTIPSLRLILYVCAIIGPDLVSRFVMSLRLLTNPGRGGFFSSACPCVISSLCETLSVANAAARLRTSERRFNQVRPSVAQ